jgi:putative peptide zinc metalloprotease protein
VIYPAFYTDVTDAYRLDRRGRVRTDLGGVYFNLVFVLGLYGAYAVWGLEALLAVVAIEHVLIANQFWPWLRLDGYYVVADLIGVSDLFSRIQPVLRGLVPGRPLDPRVGELKGWARAAVTGWVLTTVSILIAMAALTAVHAPAYVSRAWSSLVTQTNAVRHAVAAGDVAAAVASGFGGLFLLLPVLGMSLIYVLLCRRLGAGLALSRARAAGLTR